MEHVDSGTVVPADVRLARRLAPLLVLGAVLCGLLVGLLANGPVPVLALLLPLALVPVLLWRSPRSGVLILLGSAVVVEQFPYMVGSRPGAVTSRIPFFHTVTPGSAVTPMAGLLLLLVGVWLLKSVQVGQQVLPASRVGRMLALLTGLLAAYVIVGLGRHGALKPAMWEIQPFLYVGLVFLLSSALLTTQRAVRTVLWTLVIGSGIKAFYGLQIFLSVRHASPRPDAVLGHEESFFFGLFVILVIGLWTFGVRGPLRNVATALLPVVLMADMVNSRRTAWALLFGCGLLMTAISYVRLPARRPMLLRCMAVVGVGLAIYLPLFWGKTGSTAQPARAVRSVVAPSSSDARDSSSDRYRMLEDANLALNIRSHRSTGTGFGVPIHYDIPMVDLTGIASMLTYVPHDGVYWVWMRMGIVGEGVFLLFIAESVIAACRLTTVRDPETALLGAVVACALLGYMVMGQKDLGFYWFRIAVCMGVLLGAVDARSRQLRLGLLEGER